MSNPVTPGQPGTPYGGAPGPYGAPAPQGQFGPAAPQGQFGPAPQGQFGSAPQGQFGPASVPPPPTQRKRSKARLIVSIVSIVVLGVIALGGYILSRSSPENAKVGDCLKGAAITSTTAQDAGDVKIVPCTSTDAKYKVVGKVDNKTRTEFNTDDTICAAYTSAGATTALWGQTSGSNGFVLCLADNK